MANFETPTPVKIDPLNLGEIKKENALSSLYNQRLADMAYESNARNALNDAMKRDPTGQNVLRDVAARGFGSSALDAVGKIGTNHLRNAQIAKAQTDFISTYAPLIKDQASLDMVRAKYQGTFGQDVPPQFHTYYDGLGQDALKLSLGSAGNIQLQREENTAKALGTPAGADPSVVSNVTLARNADQRAAESNSRERELQPYRVDNLQSEIDARNTRAKQPRVIMMPDPNDSMGFKKVPGHYDEATNSVMPLQVAPAVPSGDLSPGQTPPQSGQGQQGGVQFNSLNDVVEAVKSGKLPRADGETYARKMGWIR
jgi:hypothetical protein